jgi:flagellar biosynthesis protein FlhB
LEVENMDLFSIYKDLVKETLLFKSLKGLTVAKRVLCIIVLSPFIALYTTMLLVYGAIVTLYRMFNGHLNSIHDFIKNERREIRHATEAVVYWIAFPWIFVCKVLLAIITFVLMFVHFSTSLVGYIATFGGIRFCPFMLEPVDRFKNKDIVKHNPKAVTIFIIIGLILLSLSVVLKPICDQIYDAYKENAIVENLVSEVKRLYDNKKTLRYSI